MKKTIFLIILCLLALVNQTTLAQTACGTIAFAPSEY